MIENQQLYSYIVHSLDILNRSVAINEQNTVKLFSYLYNNSLNTEKIFESKLNSINNYINSNINTINNDIKNLENCIIKINDQINILENNINTVKRNVKKINSDLVKHTENIIEVPIIVSDEISFVYKLEDEYLKFKNDIKKILLKIKDLYNKIYNNIYYNIITVYNKIYNRIYNFIFRKRIQREKEEEEKRKEEERKKEEERLILEQIEKDKQRKELIKQILNTPFNNHNGH